MKIALAGVDLEPLQSMARELGVEVVEQHPEVVVTNGGDGTLLQAEQQFPGVPKLALRASRNCRKCPQHQDHLMLENLVKGTLDQTSLTKLETHCGRVSLIALNDIILRNETITSAVRFRVDIDGRNHSGEIIGDGLVIATPFGSSAYYRSITHSIFQVGMGLAFNNSTEQVDHLVLNEESQIKVTILRGPALVAADNGQRLGHLDAGDCFVVHSAPETATILGLDALRCPDCERYPDIRRPDYLDRRIRPSSSHPL